MIGPWTALQISVYERNFPRCNSSSSSECREEIKIFKSPINLFLYGPIVNWERSVCVIEGWGGGGRRGQEWGDRSPALTWVSYLRRTVILKDIYSIDGEIFSYILQIYRTPRRNFRIPFRNLNLTVLRESKLRMKKS